MRATRPSISVAAIVVVSLSWLLAGIARASEPLDLAGEYRCRSGCRLTDADPTIAVDGEIAHCMNELGGTYTGRVLSRTTVACFNKTGTLSADGKTILWSNGAVWERR